jgi:hypothetical protein
MKLFVKHFSPVSCYFLCVRPDCLPQHALLERCKSLFFPSIETKFHTHTEDR